MSANDAVPALNKFLTSCARSAVVRLWDPSFDRSSSGLFTGFFVSPVGHLLTAFHPLRHRLWVIEFTAAEFDLEIEFDATEHASEPREDTIRLPAVCKQGWGDHGADWAVLKVNYAPRSYLPVAAAGHLQPPHDSLCSQVRAYGFTKTQPVFPSLGAYEGQYSRALPEISRFRMSFVNRGVGQSGGPVIDLQSRTVIGVVSGLQAPDGELLTADAAVIDRATFPHFEQECNLDQLAEDWRRLAAEYLASHLIKFELLAGERSERRLPDRYLRGRAISKKVIATLIDQKESVIFLHGARGSGKTALAIEVSHELKDRGTVESVFWYDFDQARKRSGDQLIPSLALHLMTMQGAFYPLEQLSYGQTDENAEEITDALSDAVRHGRQMLVFENVHFLQRKQQKDVLLLLERLAHAAAAGDSKVIFTSWDVPEDPLRFAAEPVDGLAGREVEEYFRLHGLDLSLKALSYIRDYAYDIVCLEMFVRSPEWRAAVEIDRELPKEPEPLLSYWVERYTKEHVPAPARGILLALGVLEEPAEYDTLEAVSAIRRFPENLDTLRTSPPLVKTETGTPQTHATSRRSTDDALSTDYYSAHLNVRRAVLAASDKNQIDKAQKRAADFWDDRRSFATAARHRLRSGDPRSALTSIQEHRDEIIAGGGPRDLEALANELEQSLTSADAVYELHVIRASCSNIRGNYTDARKYWRFALRHPPDELSAAMLHNRRGDSYRLASDYRAASSDYKDAITITEQSLEIPYLKELGRARLGLAKLARLKADYIQARRYYGDAHEAFEECRDQQGMIETEYGIGEVSRLVCHWQESRQAYSASLERAKKTGNAERKAYALWGLGEVQRLTEDYAAAENSHEEGLQGCREVNDTRSEGWALLGLAETHRAIGALVKSRAFYEKAEERFVRTHSDTEIAHATLGRCEAERAEGRFHFDQYAVAERTYRDKELRHCLLLCLTAKAAALRLNDKEREAAECLDEARQLALAVGLEHELSIISSMQADPASAPPLPLNFP